MDTTKITPAAANIISAFLRILAVLLLPLPIQILYGLRIKHRSRLREIRNTGAILVSNHCLYLEPIFNGLAVWPRKLLYAAEMYNIKRRDVGWLNRFLGAFGIPKERPMAIAPMIGEQLSKKRLIQFYPEGKLYYKNRTLKKFFPGAFYLAYKFGVPILPLTEALLPRALSRIFPFLPPKVILIIGKPVYPVAAENGRGTPMKKMAVYMADKVRRKMQKTMEKELNHNLSPKKSSRISRLILAAAMFLFCIASGFPAPPATEADSALVLLRDAMYDQRLADHEIARLYLNTLFLLSESKSLTPEKLYKAAAAEYYMGRAYQSFGDIQTVINHSRDLRKGKFIELQKYYTKAEEAVGHYERGLAHLDLAIALDNRGAPVGDIFRLYGEMLGQLVLLKDAAFALRRGPSINRYIRMALAENNTNVKVRILIAASKIYPPPIYGGNPKKGIEMMKILLSEPCLDNEDLFNIHSGIGYGYYLLGETENSQLWLNKALRIYPGNVFTKAILQLSVLEGF